MFDLVMLLCLLLLVVTNDYLLVIVYTFVGCLPICVDLWICCFCEVGCDLIAGLVGCICLC